MTRRCIGKGLVGGLVLLFLCGLTGLGTVAAEEVVRIAGVLEISGNGAAIADFFIKGMKDAAEEINAAGGIQGKKVVLDFYDTRSLPAPSVAAMKRAVATKPFAIMGTIYSGSTLANMRVAQEAGIPQFTGSENWTITRKGNPYIFRTSHHQGVNMEMLLKWAIEEKRPSTLAMLYVNNAFGVGARDFVKMILERYNIPFVDVPAEQGQTDYTAELTKIRNTGADTLLLYLNEEESAIALRGIRKLGLQVRILGDNPVFSTPTLRLAKEDANGVVGVASDIYSAEVPRLRQLAKRYKERFGEEPDNEYFKGYNGLHTIAAVANMVGLDQKKFIDKLHGLYLDEKISPYLTEPIYYDENGDLYKASWLVRVENGEVKVIKRLPPLKGPGR
ncbi:MAG: amino acid ABC transporter substrate-binding protein [Nitrospinota bacterium]|nr:MAG: amino acid ABC transporter substrate-binding protein [Nitrospinota bacterium]